MTDKQKHYGLHLIDQCITTAMHLVGEDECRLKALGEEMDKVLAQLYPEGLDGIAKNDGDPATKEELAECLKWNLIGAGMALLRMRLDESKARHKHREN